MKSVNRFPLFFFCIATLLVVACGSRSEDSAPTLQTQSAGDLINQSLAHFQQGEYEQCIESSTRALELDPSNAIAYNNICASYNALEEYEKGIAACERALAIQPDFQLAANNLKSARKRLERASD